MYDGSSRDAIAAFKARARPRTRAGHGAADPRTRHRRSVRTARDRQPRRRERCAAARACAPGRRRGPCRLHDPGVDPAQVEGTALGRVERLEASRGRSAPRTSCSRCAARPSPRSRPSRPRAASRAGGSPRRDRGRRRADRPASAQRSRVARGECDGARARHGELCVGFAGRPPERPRADQLSPTSPSSRSSSASSTTSRSSTAGRRTISSTTPSSRGAARIASRAASRSHRRSLRRAPSRSSQSAIVAWRRTICQRASRRVQMSVTCIRWVRSRPSSRATWLYRDTSTAVLP